MLPQHYYWQMNVDGICFFKWNLTHINQVSFVNSCLNRLRTCFTTIITTIHYYYYSCLFLTPLISNH